MVNELRINKEMKSERYWNGCVSSDDFKSPIKVGTQAINLFNAHWVCIINYGDSIIYFDPLARVPIPNVKAVIESQFKPKEILYNHIRDETYISKRCGEICCEFMKAAAKGPDYAHKFVQEHKVFDKLRDCE